MGIEFRNVSKNFGGTLVVDDLSLEIRDGEFVVLLGPSGCGKTTTLRMLAGLESISSGDVFIGQSTGGPAGRPPIPGLANVHSILWTDPPPGRSIRVSARASPSDIPKSALTRSTR